MILFEPPINHLIAGVLGLVGMYTAAESTRLVARGLRLARPLDVVRGIRACVFSLVAGVFVVGVLSGHTGFLILGAIILGEEIYETGILAAIIRFGEREEASTGRDETMLKKN